MLSTGLVIHIWRPSYPHRKRQKRPSYPQNCISIHASRTHQNGSGWTQKHFGYPALTPSV